MPSIANMTNTSQLSLILLLCLNNKHSNPNDIILTLRERHEHKYYSNT